MGGEDQLGRLPEGIKILAARRHRLANHLIPGAAQCAVEKIGGRTLGAGGCLQGHEGASQFKCIHERERPANGLRGGAPGLRENAR